MKIVILGIGRWGIHLVRIFLSHPDCEVIAIVDPNRERLDLVRDRLKLAPNIILTTDLEYAMNQEGIVSVVIASWAITHYSLVKAALLKGYHVLVEKPLTLDYHQGLELCQLAESKKLILVVDHTYLFHRAVILAKSAINRLGTLHYGYSNRTNMGPVRSDVNALWDLGIHDLYIWNYWLDSVPVGNQIITCTNDLCWIKLIYPHDLEVILHLSWSNWDKNRRIGLVGSDGTLIFDELANPSLIIRNESIESIPVPNLEPLANCCYHFIECVMTHQPSQISSGWVGLELVNILSRINPLELTE